MNKLKIKLLSSTAIISNNLSVDEIDISDIEYQISVYSAIDNFETYSNYKKDSKRLSMGNNRMFFSGRDLSEYLDDLNISRYKPKIDREAIDFIIGKGKSSKTSIFSPKKVFHRRLDKVINDYLFCGFSRMKIEPNSSFITDGYDVNYLLPYFSKRIENSVFRTGIIPCHDFISIRYRPKV